jgi:hypothetical protein
VGCLAFLASFNIKECKGEKHFRLKSWKLQLKFGLKQPIIFRYLIIIIFIAWALSPGGTLVNFLKKYVSKSIGCNILVVR